MSKTYTVIKHKRHAERQKSSAEKGKALIESYKQELERARTSYLEALKVANRTGTKSPLLKSAQQKYKY